MAGKGRPGRDPSGRHQTTVRLTHWTAIQAAAQARGMGLSNYVDAVLSEHLGLPLPDEARPSGGQLALSDEGAAA